MAGLKKLLKRHGGKKSSASKEDVRSVADGGEVALGYVITKDKDLPKLHKAIWHGDVAKVKQLCKKSDINQFDKENRTPLHLASASGNEEITQFLLANKAKTNLCDNDGRTALMKAIECSHHGCIEMLLHHNADVKVTDQNCSSPLHLAAANNLIDVATRLLEKGVIINISDKEGFTALHVASSLGNQDFVLFLLNKGANVDSTDGHGRTALMTAAAEGLLDIVKMLLQNNADVSLKDSEGWKAADHAVMNGNHSCAKIIDEHEKRQVQEREKMTEDALKRKKKPDISEVLRSSSPVNDDLGFSFGGPAADKVTVDGNLRSEGSTSRPSDADDSWGSSSDENSETIKKSSKISLAAALQKVQRSTSNISTNSQSRIPVRNQVKSPSPDPVPRTKSAMSPSLSKIPRPVSSKSPFSEGRPSSDVSQSQSPRGVSVTGKENVLSPTASVKSLDSNSARNSPGASVVNTSPGVRSRIASPTESLRSAGSGMQGRLSRRESGGSLPLEYLKAAETSHDSVEGSKGKRDGSVEKGYSPSFLSPQSDRSNRNLADELGLSLSSSEGDGEEDEDLESALSGEVVLDNVHGTTNEVGQKPGVFTSTTKPEEESPTKEAKNPAAYLGLDLNSSISSVSDPEISGMSNDKEGRKKNEETNDLVQKSAEHKNNGLKEDTDSNWDSSEGCLPSDDENISGKKLSPKGRNKSSLDQELHAAVEKRRENLERSMKLYNYAVEDTKTGNDSLSHEDESELTESESEWAKEREELRKKELEKMRENAVAQMKVEENRKKEVERKLELEMEKEKEEARRLEWERQEREKEIELAERIKRELEEELRTDGHNERSEEKEEGSYGDRESELKSGSSVHIKRQQEVNTSGHFEDQGSSKWDSTEDEGLNEDDVSVEDPQDSEVSVETEVTPEDELASEAKFEKQMELKEKEKMREMLNNNTVEPLSVQRETFFQERIVPDIASSPTKDVEEEEGYEGERGQIEINKGVVEDARRLQKEEDELLEAYKARQEEMLEQERRVEEDMARKEQERLEELRLELERRNEEERLKMAELERQRKERELALQREREAFEEEMKRKEKEREIEELNSRRKQAEDERRRMEVERSRKELEEMTDKDVERKARLQEISTDTVERVVNVPIDSEYVPKTKAERLLTEKHRTFVEDAANSTALELQKVHNRERLADKSREIKQRQLQAKADLDAVRLQTTKLAEPSKVDFSSPRGSSSPVKQDNIPVSAETEKVKPGLPPAASVNSDWSTSEDEREVPLSRIKTPLSSADGGLGSSMSPGVHSLIRPGLLQSTPLLSSSPAIMESSSLVGQLKGSLRDCKRQLEKTQEKLMLSETKIKQLESHADDLQSKLEEMVHQKSVAERELFEINEENRVLKHESLRAAEDKKIAEALVDTVKDQLGRSEQKLTREIKLRRTVEEAGKQLEADRLDLENALHHMTQDLEDLKKAFEREQEQSRLKDELYREQRKQNEEIIMESQKVSQHRAEALTKLETADESRKNVEASSESLRKELILAKREVGRLNSQLESVQKLSQSEVDSFKRQLADQMEKNRRLEDTLGKVRSEYDLQVSQLEAGNSELQNKLENELTARHRVQSEATVLGSRVESIEKERNEANKTRVEVERQLHNLREEMYKSKSTLERELSSLRETNQLSILKLNTAENKISSLEAELQTANIMLTERSSQMSITIQDIDTKRTSLAKLETELRAEKEANAKLSGKLEAASEKMRNLENESGNLRRQLETATEKVRRQEESSQETQNKLHSTISEIKTDYEKTKGKMSEKERRLADALDKYKEEMEQNFTKLKLQDDNIRRLQQELADATRKLSAAEASLEIQQKARVNVEEERDHLRQTLRNYEGQISATVSENKIINGHASALQSELEHSQKVSDETSQRLATTAYDLENLEKIKVGLEGDVTKLRLDRVKLEATLREEKAKTDLLLHEIRENNEGRTQLESLLSQIKSSNIELEEKLQSESFLKSQHAREAEEAKGLWESEVRARSKLGAKIIEMENKVNEGKVAVEEEKKKTRKALESRKALLGKLDVYEKRSDQHQKEVQTLKAQIKGYKRRLKENESTEKRIPTIQAEFSRECLQYEANITSLRNQLRELNERLRQEGDLRIVAECRAQQCEKDLSSAKIQAKEQLRQMQKLEKVNRQLEDELERLKEHCNDNFVDKAQLDRMKMDLEAKSRIELNRKLADVNAHLEEQALAREALERSRNEQESLKLKEMENTISRLKKEIEQYRSNFHELQTQKETIEVEAERFKDMYESESKRKDKLNDLLYKEREKSAESKALLNLERSRSSKFLGNSTVNMKFLERSPGILGIPKNESMNSKSPAMIYSLPKDKLMESVNRELDKSIRRHLDSISPDTPSDRWASKEINMTSSPLTSSSSQYMETLKRNYFV